MVSKTILVLFGVLLLIPSGFPLAFDETVFCFNAQVQDVFLICSREILVSSLRIKTLNDTTGVKQKFHLDYLHPITVKWTTYQEDRHSKIYYLPSEDDSTNIVFRDQFVARYLRVSLLKEDSLGWLGELCANIELIVKKKIKNSCPAGSYGDGEYCTDINECADTTGNFCPRKQRCDDFPRSYSCLGTCLGDLVPNSKTKVCEDLCFHNGYVCDKNARCVNARCVCDLGFKGDGIYCLDRCTIKGLTCHPYANCIEGDCSCRSGYKGNGEICQAVCHSGNRLCHPDAICESNICKCNSGFIGDGLSKCVFSRVQYEKEKKMERTSGPRLDVVSTDLFEVLHNWEILRSLLNQESNAN